MSERLPNEQEEFWLGEIERIFTEKEPTAEELMAAAWVLDRPAYKFVFRACFEQVNCTRCLPHRSMDLSRIKDEIPGLVIRKNDITRNLSDVFNAPIGSLRYVLLQWLVGCGPFVTIPLALAMIAVLRWYAGRDRGDREAEPVVERIAGILRSSYRSCFAAGLVCLAASCR